MELRDIVDKLEQADPLEKKGFLYVTDDLAVPISFQDREMIKNSYMPDIQLPEIVVTPNIFYQWKSYKHLSLPEIFNIEKK